MIKTIIIFILLNVFIFANEKQDSIPEKKMNILSYSPKIAFAYGNSTITNQNYPQLVDYNTNLNEMNGIEIAFSYDRRFPKDSLGNYSKLFWGVSLGYGMYSAKYISFENFRSVYTDNGPLLLEESNNIDLDFNVFSIAPKITYMVIEDEKYFFTIGFLPKIYYINKVEALRYATNANGYQYKDFNFYGSKKVIYSGDIKSNNLAFALDFNADFNYKINNLLKFLQSDEKRSFDMYFGIGIGTNLFVSSILNEDNLNFNSFEVRINAAYMF